MLVCVRATGFAIGCGLGPNGFGRGTFWSEDGRGVEPP